MQYPIVKNARKCLAEKSIQLLPHGPSQPLLTLLLRHDVDTEVPPSSLDIHLVDADNLCAVPELVEAVEQEDDGEGHDLEEEVLHQRGSARVHVGLVHG